MVHTAITRVTSKPYGVQAGVLCAIMCLPARSRLAGGYYRQDSGSGSPANELPPRKCRSRAKSNLERSILPQSSLEPRKLIEVIHLSHSRSYSYDRMFFCAPKSSLSIATHIPMAFWRSPWAAHRHKTEAAPPITPNFLELSNLHSPTMSCLLSILHALVDARRHASPSSGHLPHHTAW